MFRCWTYGLAVCSLLAQNPLDLFEKAPPDIDDALRARINQFYQYHVEGKFRQAEQLVADDTKDFFYSANKPRYLGCTIDKIKYSENYTRALATILCETIVPILGFADKPVKVPLPSRWKLEKGQWFWYVDQELLKQTPFGTPQPGTAVPSSGAGSGVPALPDKNTVLKQLELVKADRSSVRLKSHEPSSAEVRITNGMPGDVTLRLGAPTLNGLEAHLDRTTLSSGQQASLKLTYKPAGPQPARPLTVTVVVEPINRQLPIQVEFEK